MSFSIQSMAGKLIPACEMDIKERSSCEFTVTNIALEAFEESNALSERKPILKLSEKGFMLEYFYRGDLISVLKQGGVLKEHETLISVEDQDFQRGGAECFISQFKITVEEDAQEKVKYGVVKCWVGVGKGAMMERRRAHLMECGMKVLPQFGTLPSERNAHDIQATFQHHADPLCYEAGTRVLEGKEIADILTPEQGEEVGKIAAILDANRYTPTRVLADVLVGKDGLIFNDFGFDLGDPGPKTEKYYGCEIQVEYSSGVKALTRELQRNQPALNSAISAYGKYQKC